MMEINLNSTNSPSGVFAVLLRSGERRHNLFLMGCAGSTNFKEEEAWDEKITQFNVSTTTADRSSGRTEKLEDSEMSPISGKKSHTKSISNESVWNDAEKNSSVAREGRLKAENATEQDAVDGAEETLTRVPDRRTSNTTINDYPPPPRSRADTSSEKAGQEIVNQDGVIETTAALNSAVTEEHNAGEFGVNVNEPAVAKSPAPTAGSPSPPPKPRMSMDLAARMEGMDISKLTTHSARCLVGGETAESNTPRRDDAMGEYDYSDPKDLPEHLRPKMKKSVSGGLASRMAKLNGAQMIMPGAKPPPRLSTGMIDDPSLPSPPLASPSTRSTRVDGDAATGEITNVTMTRAPSLSQKRKKKTISPRSMDVMFGGEEDSTPDSGTIGSITSASSLS